MADMCITKTPWIDKIFLPGATDPAYFADYDARQEIKSLKDAVKGGTVFCGVYTDTKMEDGGTVPAQVTPAGATSARDAKAGDLIINKYGEDVSREFVHDGAAWRELGSTGALKALAYKDTASAAYQPAGSVSLDNVTAAGTIGLGGVTAAGSVSLDAVTPAGTVALTGVTAGGNVSLDSVKAEGNVSLSSVKPEGTIAGTSVSLGCSVGSVQESTYCLDSANNELVIAFATAKSFVQSVCVSGVTDPSFTGTGMCGTATFEGTAMCGTATFTGTGMCGNATFTGTGMCGNATFSGTGMCGEATFCGSGMCGSATFTGTCATITVS